MPKWIRLEKGGKPGVGTLEGDVIAVHTGNIFEGAKMRTFADNDVLCLP